MNPSVGRIVHFNTDTDRKVAAVVTHVIDATTVDLVLLGSPTAGDDFVTRSQEGVYQGEAPWTWAWPARDDVPGVPGVPGATPAKAVEAPAAKD